MSHKDSSPIHWALNSKVQPPLEVQKTEYHLVRQIILLNQRKINDLSVIIQSIKPYSSYEIFNHLSRFKSPNPNLNSLVFDEVKPGHLNSQSVMQQSLQMSTRPHLKANKSFILNSHGQIIEDDLQKRSFKKINVFDKFQSTIDNRSIFSPSHTLINFTKKKSLDRSLNNTTVDLASTLDMETLVNFLEYFKVPFLPNDVLLIFEEMGCTGGSLKLEELERYFGLEVWT